MNSYSVTFIFLPEFLVLAMYRLERFLQPTSQNKDDVEKKPTHPAMEM